LKSFSFDENRPLAGGVFLLLLLSFVVLSSGPLWDIDFWWHLASGRYIAEHKSLFDSNPFCFTSSPEDSNPMMNAYWVSQLFFYFVFTLFGPAGIIAARVLLLSAALAIIYFAGIRRGASAAALVVVLLLTGWVTLKFTGERPQLFSFLLAPVVVLLLDDIGEGLRKTAVLKPRSLAALCVLMVVWANLHGGFIMGTALIFLFCFSELIRLVAAGKPDLGRCFRLCSAALLPAAATLVNPNTYRMYLVLLQMESGSGKRRISEYASPITLMVKDSFLFPAYWIYLLLFLVTAGLCIRKIDRTHLLMSAFLAGLSLSSLRYVPFFIYVTAPMTALYLSKLVSGRVTVKGLLDKAAWTALSGALVWTVAGFSSSLGQTLKNEIKEYRFPVEASAFLMKNTVSGNIFNHWNWGGYLEWTLFPAHRVFIDGRVVNPATFADYTYMLWDEKRGPALLDRYGIQTVIMPALNPITGELYRLVDVLLRDRHWHLVFADETALVFLRGEQNSALVRKYSLPDKLAYAHIIQQARHLLGSEPGSVNAVRALEWAEQQ